MDVIQTAGVLDIFVNFFIIYQNIVFLEINCHKKTFNYCFIKIYIKTVSGGFCSSKVGPI